MNERLTGSGMTSQGSSPLDLGDPGMRGARNGGLEENPLRDADDPFFSHGRRRVYQY